MRFFWAVAVLLGLLVPEALAHTGEVLAGGFVAGFGHPFGGLDHALAMVAVGIWGAILGRSLVWLLPVLFPLMMVVGGVAGIADVGLPWVEVGIALSVIALGTVIALGWAAPQTVALSIVGAFAIFHGYAHGQELPEAASPAAYAAGFVLATGLLHVAGILIGLTASLPHGLAALRAGGAAIAALGVWILAGAPGAV
jgi:urease accessory protein